MPIDLLEAIGSLIGGGLLGVFYFAGLWWTVHRLGGKKFISTIFIFSMLLRTVIVISGFYLLLGDHWMRLALALLGFILVRMYATQLIKRTAQSDIFKLE